MTKKNESFGERLSRGIDNLVGIFSPGAAYRRKAFRRAQGLLGSYRGADKTRLRGNWWPGSGSADEDLLPDLATLRERSRDLNRNDAHAVGITTTVTSNTVGTGIKPQSRVKTKNLGISDEAAGEFQQIAEDNWEKWCPFADAGNRMDFYEIQNLVDRQILENGEIILLPLMLPDKSRPFSLALDIIEADRLQTPPDKKGDKSVRYGVEIGERGEPVAYYIRETHPGDLTLAVNRGQIKFMRIPAMNETGRKNVFHLYWVNRPGQTRGVPFFAPVMNYFKDLADYMEAELVAARVAACFAIFVRKEDSYAAAVGGTSETNSKGQRIQELEPGMIDYLSPGEDISAFNPNRPGGQFEPFVDRILRAISTGLNLPYEIVAKDFSKTNYSSARAALLEARRYFMVRQSWLARKLCQPVWDMVQEEAFLKNQLPAKSFYEKKSDWCRVRWIAPGWQWVDPVKEAKSSQMAIDIGISTMADEAASQGKDWEEVLEQRAREATKVKDLEEKYGVKILGASSGDGGAGAQGDLVGAASDTGYGG
ncbi:MAG: phage portal protein [Parcubacteria group bacterium]|nr:phage portal protein [Parcubacteria group bacterium]